MGHTRATENTRGKESCHRGEIRDVRQIWTQKGDESMGEKVIFGLCVFLVKSEGQIERDRGENKYCAGVGVETVKKTKTCGVGAG